MRRLPRVPWKKILVRGTLSGVLLVLVLFGLGYALTDIPEPSKVSTAQTTVIRYATGEELARLGTNRELVALSDVTEPAQKAVLAAEDRGFYSEPGISPKGIARALFTNVKGGGGVQQGGSTITQQYAKNAFLTQERTYSRKVKEVFISLKMTRERSKEQILEDYLNTIYFGRGALGIEAASRAYFGPSASASTLTTAQGAVLAASIRSPAGYDPSRHPERARERFDYVLDGMVSEGWLSPEERARVTYPEVIAPGTGTTGPDLGGPLGHVVDAVRTELVANGTDEAEIDSGGLVVTTTLRKPAQDAAAKAVEAITKGDKGDQALQGALVSVEPGTGKVVAYYGGANGTGYDYAGGVALPPEGTRLVTAQPGSSFKAYVLAAALSQGIPLSTTLDGNSPKDFPGVPGDGIHNFGDGDGTDYGRVDLVRATEDSVNTAYYELATRVGPDKVAELAHAAGVTDRVSLSAPGTGQRTAGIALGQYEVRVTDQATGFATFAAGGTSAKPYLVQQVEQDGAPTYQARVQTRVAFSKEVAADADVALQAVVQSGSGTRARLAGGRPAAGKTGTTSDNQAIWFAGFTPQLSAAVWFGYGTPRTIEIPGLRGEATGGGVASGVWKAYMDVAMTGQPVQQFPPRAGIGRATAPVRTAPPSTAPTPRRSATAPPTPTAPPTTPTTPAPTTPPPSTSATPTSTPTRTPARPSASATPTSSADPPRVAASGSPAATPRTGSSPGSG